MLFGGYAQAGTLGDTWDWDGVTWRRLWSPVGPARRWAHCLFSDTARDVVGLYGGGDQAIRLGDTWTLDGGTWARQHPENVPPPRRGAAVAWDETRRVAVLFGGQDGGVGFADTWEWDGEDWTQLDPNRAPPPRRYAGGTYAAARSEVVLFGGKGSQTNLDDTWLLPSLATARPAHILTVDLAAAAAPPGAELHALTATLYAGGDGQADGEATTGASLLVWHTAQGRWLPQAANAHAPDQPALPEWEAPAPETLPDLLFRDGLRFAVTPVGTNGSGYATVATDYAEVVVGFRLP